MQTEKNLWQTWKDEQDRLAAGAKAQLDATEHTEFDQYLSIFEDRHGWLACLGPDCWDTETTTPEMVVTDFRAFQTLNADGLV